MGGQRVPGAEGLDDEPLEGDGAPPRGGFSEPGPIGLKGGGVRFVDRKIANVSDDWHPPSINSTDQEISAPTLAEVGRLLNTLPEWGRGGGRIRSDAIAAGSSPTVDVNLHANLEKTMPKWLDYSSASAAAKAEWDRMFAALEAHEQGHIDIAIKVADDLKSKLPGKSIDDLVPMINAANRQMKSLQDDFDTKTAHGQNTGVNLNTSIP